MGEAAFDQTIFRLRDEFIAQNRERAEKAMQTLGSAAPEDFDADRVYFLMRFFHQYAGVAETLGFPKPARAVHEAIWDLRQAMNGLRPLDAQALERLRAATLAVRGAIESEAD